MFQTTINNLRNTYSVEKIACLMIVLKHDYMHKSFNKTHGGGHGPDWGDYLYLYSTWFYCR